MPRAANRRPDLVLGGGFLFLLNGERTVNQATCPTCDAPISLPDGAVVHELISCPDCGTDLEILSLTPLTIDLAPEVEEDWGE
jgi:alpha-aminoadipate carrier protein LysW